jgi:translocation and assembly module TamB
VKRWIVIALLVPLAVPAALLVLSATEAGSRWLLDAASRTMDRRFSYESVQGDLLSEIEFSKLAIRAAGHRATAETLILGWRPSALLAGRFHLQRFHLAQVDYTAPEAKSDAGSGGAPAMSLSLPVGIQIDEASIEGLLIHREGGQNRIDRIAMQDFGVDGNMLTMTRLEVVADALELTAHGHVDPAPPHAVEAGIAWSAELPDGTPAAGVGNVSGTLESVRVEHALTMPFAVDFSGTVSPLADPAPLDFTAAWKSLRWPLRGTAEFSSESGTLSATGSLRQLALSLDGSIESDSIAARSLRIDADLKRSGDDLEASLRWRAALSDGVEAAGNGTLAGNAEGIAIEHVVERPVQISTRGRIDLAANSPELSLDGEWKALSWPIRGEPTVSSPSGRYRVKGVLDALRFQLDADLRSKAAQIEQLNLAVQGQASASAPFPFEAELSFEGALPEDIPGKGRATIKGNAERINIDGSIDRPVELKARGDISLAGDASAIDLSGEWQNLRWPLSGDAEFESENGSFTLSGPLQQLALQMKAKSSGRKVPPAETRLDARVRPDGARIDALDMQTLGGEIRASGDIGWQPAPSWRLQVSASSLKPDRYFQQWPGEISFEGVIDGGVEGGTPKLSVDGLRLDGRLLGYPVEGSGAVSFDGTTVSARNLRLRSGDNRLAINGDAGHRLNLSFVIDAPALNAVAPDLEGSLEGKGQLRGSPAEPQVSAKLSGNNLAWRNSGAARLALDMDASAKPRYPSRVALLVDGLRADGRPLGRASLSGKGTPEQHRLTLDVSAATGSLSAEAEGRYREGAWSGTLRSSIESEDFGQWRTPQPAAITASGDGIRLQRICLEQTPTRVCAAASWRAEGDAIDSSGEMTKLPLALLRPYLPQGLGVEGSLDGEFKAGGTLSAPRAEARISAGSGRIVYPTGAGADDTGFAYRDGRVELSYAPSGARLQMGVELENAGSVRGNLETGALGNASPAGLKGRLEVDFSDLEWVGVMMPQLAQVGGVLKAALVIGGTTSNPAVTGELALEGGEANVPDLGLELRRINLAMRSEGAERVTLTGALNSGGGRLDFSGRSQLSNAGERRVYMELKGQEFEVARLPTVHAIVSPDLRLKADSKLAELGGSVHIPRAKVRLNELPQSAVTVSEDEIIVNAEDEDRSRRRRLGPSLRINLDVSLGDEVAFEGFGLTTGIDGSLAVSGDAGQSPQARGTLRLREGRYRAYGQELEIQNGRLLFAGPIDNPGIDVTAVRELRDVTAGIIVGGNVKSVNSRVFSEPPLPEAEALSYLITGRALSEGDEGDAAKLQRAAVALGLDQANVVTRQLQSLVGLDEVSVSGDGVDHTSLLLGKQITPDIFVRYALGIFEESGKLLLNYRLTDSISVQAESGEQQGADLIYKIEREKLF